MSISWIVNICNSCHFNKQRELKKFKSIVDMPLIDYKLENNELLMSCPKCGAQDTIMFNEKGERIFNMRR